MSRGDGEGDCVVVDVGGGGEGDRFVYVDPHRCEKEMGTSQTGSQGLADSGLLCGGRLDFELGLGVAHAVALALPLARGRCSLRKLVLGLGGPGSNEVSGPIQAFPPAGQLL